MRRLIADRRIAFLKLGNKVRLEPDELDRWMESQRVTPREL